MDKQEFKSRFICRLKELFKGWEQDKTAQFYFNNSAEASWEVYCEESTKNCLESPEDYAESEVDCWE